MANDNQNPAGGQLTPEEQNSAILSEVVDRLVGSQASLGDGLRTLNTQVDQLRAFTQTQTGATQDNTAALAQNTQAQGTSSTASTAANVARSASSFLTSGFGLSPVISGLLRLFGRGSEPAAPPPLVRFALPESLDAESGVTQSGSSALQPLRFSQDGLPQAVPVASAPAPVVTVNVNAIDSRSFLDHSDEIARAVRAAMLENHNLNDVISEI